jgi:NADPH:quinone reductase-like Zn-dependent oxidoreductase
MRAQFRSLQLANHLHLLNTQPPQRTYRKTSTVKALVIKGNRQASVASDRPLPQLRPGYIMVKPVAVALNPTDWKPIAGLNRLGLLCGCDYAGIVEKAWTGYTKN